MSYIENKLVILQKTIVLVISFYAFLSVKKKCNKGSVFFSSLNVFKLETLKIKKKDI